MTTISLLTCTSDRHEAFALTEKWIAAQTIKPNQWLVLDDGTKPVTCTQGQEHHHLPQFRGAGSMVNKIKHALQNKLLVGDVVIFIEDDDWVAPDYIEWCLSGLRTNDLIGEGQNLYYNVRHRWWFEHHNKAHASLCATAMRRSVLPYLMHECVTAPTLPEKDRPFIDSRLWMNCRLKKKVFDPMTGDGRRRTVGIKAMPGTKGYGSGHDRTAGWAIPDPQLAKLRALIGDDAKEYEKFYDAPVVSERRDKPRVEIHIVAFNEELILPYTLRHYRTFASRIIVHDGGSTDKTVAIATEAGAEVRAWDTGGKINDVLLRELKETAWQGTNADWVGMVDADELIHFPGGAWEALAAYEKVKLAIVKPHGWEMESPELPTTDGQIYEEINHGARDDRWYAKPVFFSARRVARIKFSAGAHECVAELHGGLLMANPVRFSEPRAVLMHYHHIGSVERIGEKYDGNKKRFSDENKKNGWGWHGDGRRHAQDKRNAILAKREKVI